ncbi:MAG: hypothetical protein QW533_00335, partial [Thermoplasmata archaeon]
GIILGGVITTFIGYRYIFFINVPILHLSKTYEEAYIAGLHRTDDPIIIEVNVDEAKNDGIEFYKATKTIYITKEIPPKYIKKARKRKVDVPEEELKEIALEKKRKEEKEKKRKEREGEI